jgi:hypothetical protein
MIEASYLGGNANQFCPSFKDTKESMLFHLIRNNQNSIRKEYNGVMEMVESDIYHNYKTFAFRAYEPKSVCNL